MNGQGKYGMEGVSQVEADPYQLAASYKDDLGFLTKQEAPHQAGGNASQKGQSAFYLDPKKSGYQQQVSAAAATSGPTAPTIAEPQAPEDPIAAMRAKLEAGKAGGVKYE